MAKHFGLLPEDDWLNFVGRSAGAMRDLFLLSEHQVSGACRDDFASGNVRAQAAMERLGDIPLEIIEGVKKPQMGPGRIRSASSV